MNERQEQGPGDEGTQVFEPGDPYRKADREGMHDGSF